MKKQWFLILIAAMLLLSTAYAETAPAEEPLLYLAFDEGQGAAVRDGSGHLAVSRDTLLQLAVFDRLAAA